MGVDGGPELKFMETLSFLVNHEIFDIVAHTFLEIFGHLGIAVEGRFLLTFRLEVGCEAPRVILHLAEIGRRRVQRTLEAWVSRGTYPCLYPLFKFCSRLAQENGSVAKLRVLLAEHYVNREPKTILVEARCPIRTIGKVFREIDKLFLVNTRMDEWRNSLPSGGT